MGLLAFVFSFIALAGFLASLVAHIAGFAGIPRPFGLSPWPLHVGIFVVWLPAILAVQRLAGSASRRDLGNVILQASPRWVKYTLIGASIYAVLNFVMYFLTLGRFPNEATSLRGFSGHWMLFYFTAYALLSSYSRFVSGNFVRR